MNELRIVTVIYKDMFSYVNIELKFDLDQGMVVHHIVFKNNLSFLW